MVSVGFPGAAAGQVKKGDSKRGPFIKSGSGNKYNNNLKPAVHRDKGRDCHQITYEKAQTKAEFLRQS